MPGGLLQSNRMSKKITIEGLALMVKRGFDQTATKDDLKRFATKDELKQFATKEDLERFATKEDIHKLERRMEDNFWGVNKRLDLLHEDISDLPEIREEVRNLGTRVVRLEKKIGLVK